MKSIPKSFLLSILIIVFAFLWAPNAKAEAKPSLAIFPFFIERVEDPARGVVCPICKGVYRQGSILAGSQNTLTRLLRGKIEATGTFQILPSEKLEEALSKSDRRQIELTPIRSFVQIGKSLNVDFIFVGYLFRFEERIGSAIGAEKPASVGFDVHLIRLKDEKMVWIGKFDETQKPLSENLLKMRAFVRRKASWLTAEELSSVGMDEMFMRFPGPKELEEMR